jgi:peroxiredoxin
MECIHCAAQMNTLKEHYETLRRAGIHLVAISQYLPADAATAEMLQGFPFPILVDPELESFRNYNCIDEQGSPLHGIFLIDPANRLLFQNRTQVAVDDPVSLVLETLNRAHKGD